MVTLEQVKLLDTRVTKTVEYIKKLTDENAALKKKLETGQRRINEMETLINRFREDQGRIEEGILSALDRLNQFEDAIENMISQKPKNTPAEKSGHETKPAEIKIIPEEKTKSREEPELLSEVSDGNPSDDNPPDENPQDDEPSPVIELDIF